MTTIDFRGAIFSQPENLAAAATAFREAAAAADLASLCEGTIVLSGIGASGHALIPAMLALRAAGRRAFAVSAGELGEASAAGLGDDAVGGGPGHASAGEAALLGREGLRLPATGMETREYLHGPLEAVSDAFGCIVFGRRRERELAAALASYGASVALMTDSDADAGDATVLELPSVPVLAAPILQILPVQLLVDHVARVRGLEIGKLRRQQRDTKVR